MAPRIGYTFEVLRDMQPAACRDDIRLVWKKDDEWNMSLLDRSGELTKLPKFIATREMRLLAYQLLRFAAERESKPDPHEVVIP